MKGSKLPRGKKGDMDCLLEVVDSKGVDFLVVPVMPRLARIGVNVALVEFVNFVRNVRMAVLAMLFDAIFAGSRYLEKVEMWK